MKKILLAAALASFVALNASASSAQYALSGGSFPNQDILVKTFSAVQTYTVVGTEVVELDAQSGANQTTDDLILVVDRSSRWASQSVLKAQLSKAGGIFRTCNVVLRRILIVFVQVPDDTMSRLVGKGDPSKPPPEMGLTPASLPANIPVGFLLRDIKDQDMAKAYNLSTVEYYNGLLHDDISPLLNTFWIEEKYISPAATPNALESYSMLAHELTHILGNVGHIYTKTPNLMQGSGDPNSLNGDLNPEQCSAIRAFGAPSPETTSTPLPPACDGIDSCP